MSVDTADDLDAAGTSIVVVAIVGADLHIRIFDSSEDMVVDMAEAELESGDTLTTLKERVNELLAGRLTYHRKTS